mmetsp:Transcript_29286/g.90596  ORF Transcript_29286/g.90596 Transcript_29286/m.90596 type:complete len:321 (-) Transcript_29286:6-968(-)
MPSRALAAVASKALRIIDRIDRIERRRRRQGRSARGAPPRREVAATARDCPQRLGRAESATRRRRGPAAESRALPAGTPAAAALVRRLVTRRRTPGCSRETRRANRMSARPLAARFGAMGASAQERLIRTLGVDRVAAAMDVAERPGVTESRVLSSPDLLNMVSDHVYSLPAGGAVVPDYNNSCLSAFSPRGEQLFSASCHTSTAVAVAFLSNDLLWVAHLDSCQLQKHLIRPENRAESIELIARDCQDYPLDIAVAGEKLLLLRDDGIYTAVEVLDLETGDGRGLMLGGSLQMRSAESMAVQGDVVAIADMHNQVLSSL